MAYLKLIDMQAKEIKPTLLKIANYLDCAAELADKVEEFDELHDIVSLMKSIVEDNECLIRN